MRRTTALFAFALVVAAATLLQLEKHEAIIVNHFMGYEDFEGAGALLEQSWLVLYELRYAEVYPRPRETIQSTLAADLDGAGG